MSKPSIDPARWTPPASATAGRPVPPHDLRVYTTSGHDTEDVLVRDDGHVLTGLEFDVPIVQHAGGTSID